MDHKQALELCEENLENDLRSLTPKDRLNFYLSLLEYFTPKMNRVNFEMDSEDNIIIEVDAAKGDNSI